MSFRYTTAEKLMIEIGSNSSHTRYATMTIAVAKIEDTLKSTQKSKTPAAIQSIGVGYSSTGKTIESESRQRSCSVLS